MFHFPLAHWSLHVHAQSCLFHAIPSLHIVVLAVISSVGIISVPSNVFERISIATIWDVVFTDAF